MFLLLTAGVTCAMMFSENPSPSRRGSAEISPRQLAPSVGTLGVGIMALVVPNPAACDLPHPEDPIYFGSLCFTPHAPVALPIFEALQDGVDLTFGVIRLRADRFGILCLPDAIHPTATSTSSPNSVAESCSPDLASDFLEATESESSSVYLDDDLYTEDTICPVE